MMKKVIIILCYIFTVACYAAAVYSLIRGSAYTYVAGFIGGGSVVLVLAAELGKKEKAKEGQAEAAPKDEPKDEAKN